MFINYNIEELNNALSDFYEATGSAIILTDSDFNTIIDFKKAKNPFCELIQTTAEGKERCRNSDICMIKTCAQSGKLYIHTCHAGLMDTVVPIDYNGTIIGYVILGQMRSNIPFGEICCKIVDLKIDVKEAEKIYNSLPVSSKERIESVSNIAAMLTQYILFKNLITEQQNRLINDAVMYISANLNRNLSIVKICEDLNVSKNVLYRGFRKYKNCTVGEYINLIRVEHAKNLMISTDKSLQLISEESGFTEYSYFCKTFKKVTGITPFKYRKNYQLEK